MNDMQPPDPTAPQTIAAAQGAVDESIRALGGYWPPLANLARLFEECGELARGVNQRVGSKLIKPGEAESDVAEELGDVLFVTLVLANSLGVDAEAALTGALYRARRRTATQRETPLGE